MANKTECPKCKNKFDVKKHLKYRLQANSSFIKLVTDNMVFPWNKGLEEIYKAHLVVCPNCSYEFSASGYKYFGFIKVKQLQVGLLLFFLSFIFASLAVLFWDIFK